MRLAPTEKLGASLVMTKASKLSPAPPGFSVCETNWTMSATQRVHLGVELDAAHAVAQDRPATLPNFSLPRRLIFSLLQPTKRLARNLNRFVTRAGEIEIRAAGSRSRVVFVPALLSRGQQLLDIRATGRPSFFMRVDGGLNSGGIPQFKRPQLPVEAQAHGAVDFDHGVGNFRNAVGGISPQIRERRPEELLGFIFFRGDPPSNVRMRVAGSSTFFASFERGEPSAFCRGRYSSVFQSRPRRSSSPAPFLFL